MTAGRVRTVLGDVAAGDLGATHCHEHLITRPSETFTRGEPDLVLDDRAAARRELEAFARAGGRTVVEVSCAEFGRDPAGLAELSRATGVHVVAATGHVVEAQWAGVVDVGARTVTELTAEMVSDLTEGFAGCPGVRAGVLKAGSSRDGASPAELRVLLAAAAAQRETGAAIVTHTTAGTAPLEQVAVLERAGADLTRVLIGHQDLRLVWEDHLAIVRSGCRIGYDGVGKERHAPDAQRADFVVRLVEAGHGDAICLSSDFARRSDHVAYGGGPGLTHVLEDFLPRLLTAGVDEPQARRLVEDNPARLLAGAYSG